jgi:hypothetical protein
LVVAAVALVVLALGVLAEHRKLHPALNQLQPFLPLVELAVITVDQ